VIDSYKFGQIVVDGQIYSSDVIVFPDSIDSSWWRKSGHRLCLEDIKEILEEKPEAVVIGTGAYGLMRVDKEVKYYAQARGIELVVDKTKKAVQKFNELAAQKKTIGAFHLTC